MKKLKKLIIVFSLSFYLVGVLTPEKEKKAEAFALTTTMVLGGLALAGVGGAIAYNSTPVMQDVGARALEKLVNQGINVSEMFRINRFGLNQAMTNALADSIQETEANFSGKRVSLPSQVIYPANEIVYDFPEGFLKWGTSHLFIVKHSMSLADYEKRNMNFGLEHNTLNQWSIGSTGARYGYFDVRTPTETHYVYTHNRTAVRDANMMILRFFSIGEAPAVVSVEAIQYDSTYERNVLLGLEGVPSSFSVPSDTPINYREIMANNYVDSPTVSVDYERLENIMSGASQESISMNNIHQLITGLETSIDQGFEGQTSILNTIWNGIKDIPNLITASSTAVLGGISSLSDNLLSGLGTFTDNITKANENLWEDAGAVWSGMTAAIDNVGTNISASMTAALTGIDELLSDLGSSLATIPDRVASSTSTALTGLGDIVSDLSSTVSTIPGAISTSVTNAYSSTFAIPENYVKIRITAIQQILAPKLPKFPTREALFPSQFTDMGDWPGISADFSHYNIGEQMVVHNEAPNYYRRQIKVWISAILYFFTALFVIRRIAGVINK